MSDKINLEESWLALLEEEFHKEYMENLKKFLIEEKQKYTVFPKGNQIFNAFNSTPFDSVKVVIIGQDPYHGDFQAHGLCFSVPYGVKAPPSLLNIYKELKEDLGFQIPNHGNLSKWAEQGVFLLNSVLTVRKDSPASHANRGWEMFTDNVIKLLSDKKENLVFLLWGKYAQSKEALINTKKHLVLKAAHPSPLSAYNGFFNSKHFSKTNQFLKQHNIEEIDFSLKNYPF